MASLCKEKLGAFAFSTAMFAWLIVFHRTIGQPGASKEVKIGVFDKPNSVTCSDIDWERVGREEGDHPPPPPSPAKDRVVSSSLFFVRNDDLAPFDLLPAFMSVGISCFSAKDADSHSHCGSHVESRWPSSV